MLRSTKLYLALAAGAALVPFATPAPAFAQMAVPSVAGDYETITENATVTAIDPATRTITMRGEDGKSFSVKVGEEVRNFPQIKVGDVVSATYAQSVKFELSKVGAQRPGVVVASGVGRAMPGEKPAGAAMRETSFTALIVSVNPAANTLDVVPQSGGAIHTLHVREPSRQALLKDVKPGQLLTVTFTEAIALSVGRAAT